MENVGLIRKIVQNIKDSKLVNQAVKDELEETETLQKNLNEARVEVSLTVQRKSRTNTKNWMLMTSEMNAMMPR